MQHAIKNEHKSVTRGMCIGSSWYSDVKVWKKIEDSLGRNVSLDGRPVMTEFRHDSYLKGWEGLGCLMVALLAGGWGIGVFYTGGWRWSCMGSLMKDGHYTRAGIIRYFMVIGIKTWSKRLTDREINYIFKWIISTMSKAICITCYPYILDL